MILHNEFGWIWTTPCTNEKDLFLKIIIRKFRKIPYEHLIFSLYFTYTGNTTCQLWFDLDNSKTRSLTTIFKFHYSRNSKSSIWNNNFFTRQNIAKTLFVLDFTYTEDTTCPVWFVLYNSKTQSIATIFKIFFSRNSQISVWKPYFFARQANPKILFVLRSNYAGDTPCRVWFDLDNSLTRWKRPIFKILKNSQFTKLLIFRMKN